ncbi:MAG: 3-deoxy-7-phosphoheptulonate synthase [Vallitaleaceae bacterium]|jgi:3-deoxy-7-phosphoheptulonate synthase|nr:3-deoxy-7-phosphoheptulonate synthase [Vallitaleaceae bacterium]
MSFKIVQAIPSPQEIVSRLPMPEKLQKIKAERDAEIKAILEGKSDKFILIIGPCSADNEDAVVDYINRLAKVQEKVKDKLLLIPRIYTNKPRTTGEGYKGMLHQPDPEQKSNMLEGILAMRKMHIRSISETYLTCADEMLYPENYAYLDDILSYVAIGARSVENQQHRLAVSGIEVPTGMKNATSGDLTVMFNAIRAAQVEHTFIFRGNEVATSGNPLTHSILRGSLSAHGTSIPNYHYESIIDVIENYETKHLSNPAIIIDTNHNNSDKKYERQPKIAMETMYNRNYDSKIKQYVKGLMIESYIEEGSQAIGDNVYGKSITDPCLGWADSERLIYEIANKA